MAFGKNPVPLVEVRNWRVLARPVRFFFFLFFYFLSLRPWYSMQVIWQQGAFTFPAARAQPQQCPTSTCSPPPTLCPFPGFSPSSFPEQDHNLLLPLRDLSSEGYIILNGFAKKEPFWKAALQPIQKQLIDHKKQSCCQQHFLCCRCCVVNNHFLPPDSLFSKVKFNFWVLWGKRNRAINFSPCSISFSTTADACPKGNFLCRSNSCARTTVQKFAFGNRAKEKKSRAVSSGAARESYLKLVQCVTLSTTH